jgi:hypothetical protein
MIPENIINTGDIGVIIKPSTFIGRLIGLFTSNKSHSFNFCWEYSKLYVYEMKGFGCFRSLYSAIHAGENNWVLIKPNFPYDQTQKARAVQFCASVYHEHFNYDTLSLLKHAYQMAIKRFPLEKKKDKKLICSEFSALMANYCQPYTFKEPESVTPLDLFNSKFYFKYKY